jgi:hypothetical protein
MKKFFTVPCIIAAFVALAAAPALSSRGATRQVHYHPTSSRVVIHEIYYNSPGSDDGTNSSLNGEWMQLKNTSSEKISLKDWTVRDTAGHLFTFGTYSIGPNAMVKIHTGRGTGNATDRYQGSGTYIWNNDTDKGTLKDAGGKVIDTCSYDNAGVAYKMC